MTVTEIKTRLARLPNSTVEVQDTTGGGDHFEACIVSTVFEGKSPVEQHRIVYDALGEAVGREIHALALRTYTPGQWEKYQASKRP